MVHERPDAPATQLRLQRLEVLDERAVDDACALHPLQTLREQFDQLYEEGADSGQVMCIPLHPYLIGQPHRIGPFAEALEYIAGHDKVWLATGREIAEWYIEHHWDEAVADIDARKGGA